MNFNSFQFIFLFLPLAIAGYFLIANFRSRAWSKLWLIGASLTFYGFGHRQDLPLLALSIAINCAVSKRLAQDEGWLGLSKKSLFKLAIAANVVFLFSYKYTAFFVSNLNEWFGASVPVPHTAFPLGISFYTILQIMFLVDCYEGLVGRPDWLDYFTFASFFAYVTMGPIVRWKHVVPQLNDENSRRPDFDNIAAGLFVFVIGLFKKVVLADSFFRWADAGFAFNGDLSFFGGWIAALAYAFQLYFDFSGYSDMAIGAGLMLNLRLPQNFDAPFKSRSLIEFWSRWHISLTNFITTYLYTPIIRSLKRVTFVKAMWATLAAMVISGFWHGANWTFVLWGALHGTGLIVNHSWRKLKLRMPGILSWALTFVFVIVGLVIFRADNMAQAQRVLSAMFIFHGPVFDYVPWTGIDRVDQFMGVGWMLCGVITIFTAPSSLSLQDRFTPSRFRLVMVVGLASVALLYVNGVVSRSFVYRDF